MLKSSVSTTKLFARTGTPELHSHFFSMKSDRVIESAIRAAQNLLWQNLPPTHKLSDAAAVARLRDLVRSPAVKTESGLWRRRSHINGEGLAMREGNSLWSLSTNVSLHLFCGSPLSLCVADLRPTKRQSY